MATATKGKPATNGGPPKMVEKPSKPADVARKAIAEVESPDEQKGSEFRGVKLVLPPSMPAVFAMDMAELQDTSDGGPDQFAGAIRLIKGVIGEQQYRAVRNKIAADQVPIEDLDSTLQELLTAMTAPYGMEPGESPASDES